MENKRKHAFLGSARDMDVIEKLAPNAPKDVKDLLVQFIDRDAEIENWFQADPKRLKLLQKDPESVLYDLFTTMKLDRRPSLKHPDLGQWNFDLELKPSPVGSALFLALWQHVSSSQTNTQQFTSDPFQVIDAVASNTNSTKVEKAAVTKAFETLLGIYHIEPIPLAAFRLIPGDFKQ